MRLMITFSIPSLTTEPTFITMVQYQYRSGEGLPLRRVADDPALKVFHQRYGEWENQYITKCQNGQTTQVSVKDGASKSRSGTTNEEDEWIGTSTASPEGAPTSLPPKTSDDQPSSSSSATETKADEVVTMDVTYDDLVRFADQEHRGLKVTYGVAPGPPMKELDGWSDFMPEDEEAERARKEEEEAKRAQESKMYEMPKKKRQRKRKRLPEEEWKYFMPKESEVQVYRTQEGRIYGEVKEGKVDGVEGGGGTYRFPERDEEVEMGQDMDGTAHCTGHEWIPPSSNNFTTSYSHPERHVIPYDPHPTPYMDLSSASSPQSHAEQHPTPFRFPPSPVNEGALAYTPLAPTESMDDGAQLDVAQNCMQITFPASEQFSQPTPTPFMGDTSYLSTSYASDAGTPLPPNEEHAFSPVLDEFQPLSSETTPSTYTFPPVAAFSPPPNDAPLQDPNPAYTFPPSTPSPQEAMAQFTFPQSSALSPAPMSDSSPQDKAAMANDEPAPGSSHSSPYMPSSPSFVVTLSELEGSGISSSCFIVGSPSPTATPTVPAQPSSVPTMPTDDQAVVLGKKLAESKLHEQVSFNAIYEGCDNPLISEREWWDFYEEKARRFSEEFGSYKFPASRSPSPDRMEVDFDDF
ncbi:hypothetical protein BT69DRAFT_385730 [Atractiella rhizophila]|nr:hypothetical protein BT69DRAFT_385730 [Atractiella rhizophila]